MKYKKYHTVGTVPKFKKKERRKRQKSIPLFLLIYMQLSGGFGR
jgi:hypothetical protein